jgi:hypothetical protein
MKEEKRKGARAHAREARDESDERDEKAYEDPYEDLRSSANKFKKKKSNKLMKIWTYHFGRVATLHVRGWCFAFIYIFIYLFRGKTMPSFLVMEIYVIWCSLK